MRDSQRKARKSVIWFKQYAHDSARLRAILAELNAPVSQLEEEIGLSPTQLEFESLGEYHMTWTNNSHYMNPSKGNFDEAWELLQQIPCPKCGATSKCLKIEKNTLTVTCGDGKAIHGEVFVAPDESLYSAESLG